MKGKKTGGRVRKTIQYNEPNLKDYEDLKNMQPLYYNDGTASPVTQWGSLYIYNGRKGTGGKNRFNEMKASGNRKIFRVWGSSKYDQINRLVKQYDKTYIKGRIIAVEDLGEFVRAYKARNWSDPIRFLASCASSGQQVHIVYSVTDGNILKELVNSIHKEWRRKNSV